MTRTPLLRCRITGTMSATVRQLALVRAPWGSGCSGSEPRRAIQSLVVHLLACLQLKGACRQGWECCPEWECHSRLPESACLPQPIRTDLQAWAPLEPRFAGAHSGC